MPSRRALLRKIAGLPLHLLLVAILLAPAAGAPTEGQDLQQETGPPPVSSPWESQQFNAPLERVRSELLALLQEDGLALVREEREEGTFATGLVDFDDKKFGVDVSIPPPKISARYPYAQMNSMRTGRYGLEGRLSGMSPTQTRLDLRALLEIRAADRKKMVTRYVPRISNGQVERQYFTRLSLRLLKPPGGTPPKR